MTPSVDSTSSIYRPLPDVLFLYVPFSSFPEILGDGTVRAVTVRNFYIYWVGFFDGFIKYDYVRL